MSKYIVKKHVYEGEWLKTLRVAEKQLIKEKAIHLSPTSAEFLHWSANELNELVIKRAETLLIQKYPRNRVVLSFGYNYQEELLP